MPPTTRRRQAQRSAETKRRLVDAAIDCLIEYGYAHTTTVEICGRAELTRGAYKHHYESTEELFVDVVARLYERLAESTSAENAGDSLESLIRSGWAKMKQPEFKAVIEVWLANRNDPVLGAAISPEIARLAQLFAPGEIPTLTALFETDPSLVGFYRLGFETLIGLALGRAASPGGAAVAHEEQVIETLLALARRAENEARADTARRPPRTGDTR